MGFGLVLCGGGGIFLNIHNKNLILLISKVAQRNMFAVIHDKKFYLGKFYWYEVLWLST